MNDDYSTVNDDCLSIVQQNSKAAIESFYKTLLLFNCADDGGFFTSTSHPIQDTLAFMQIYNRCFCAVQCVWD